MAHQIEFADCLTRLSQRNLTTPEDKNFTINIVTFHSFSTWFPVNALLRAYIQSASIYKFMQ